MTITSVTWIWEAGSLVLCHLMRFFARNAPRFGALVHVGVFLIAILIASQDFVTEYIFVSLELWHYSFDWLHSLQALHIMSAFWFYDVLFGCEWKHCYYDETLRMLIFISTPTLLSSSYGFTMSGFWHKF